jgi:uncharacterized protein
MIFTGETNLKILLKELKPKHNVGDYVFCVLPDTLQIDFREVIMHFKEDEATTLVLKRELADRLQLPYTFVMAWITLAVHSSLDAVGLTATFSNALANNGISCNVVAAFFHDHIFVDRKDAAKAIEILTSLSS